MSNNNKNKKDKRETKIEQVWNDISFQGSEPNKKQDELYFTKLFARNCVHIESLYRQAEKNCRVTLTLAGIFGVLGAVFAPIIVWLTRITIETSNIVTVTKQIEADRDCVYIAVLGMILLEVIAGLCIWANYGSRRQMEHCQDTLCDNEQFLLSLEIAAKIENADPELKGEFYKRILESDIRRREERSGLHNRIKS